MSTVRRVHERGRTARGFSIVEALVALVVLSVGMLGIAALYVESLRAGRSAIYRTQAVNLASDLADRIRANRSAGNAYARAVNVEPTPADCAPTVTTPSTVCTPTELARDDLARWLQSIRLQLPGDGTDAVPNGTVEVAPAAAATNQYTIEITWSEPGEQRPLTYVLSMQI
jgi:type IV pilus assembly protein PilV